MSDDHLYNLDIPCEPADSSVGIDATGVAWQRHGDRWYSTTQPRGLFVGPTGRRWAELLLQGPMHVICHGTVLGDTRAAAEQLQAVDTGTRVAVRPVIDPALAEHFRAAAEASAKHGFGGGR